MGTTRGSNARSDTRCTAPASQLGDRREEKRGGEAKEGERKRGWTGGEREGRREKKRWNSVVYPVIYNWKLGTTTRPKAIRRSHSGGILSLLRVGEGRSTFDHCRSSFPSFSFPSKPEFVFRALFPSPLPGCQPSSSSTRFPNVTVRGINIHGAE